MSRLMDFFRRSEETMPKKANSTASKIVLFDLETSGFFPTGEICQIAAASDTEKFSVYMVPNAMSPQASDVTGLEVHNGGMYLNGERLDTVSRPVGLASFLNFLRNVGDNIILVAHNGFRFDVPFILREIQEAGLVEKLKNIVKGFADTLLIFRDHLPERHSQKKKFSQEQLAIEFLGEASIEGAHEAQKDVKILRKLINAIGIKDDVIISASKTTEQIIIEQKLAAEETAKRHALKFFLRPDVSVDMISKIARANITMDMLQDTYNDGGESAIKMLLGEDINGRPRVTKHARVIKRLAGKLERLEQGELF